MTIEIRRLDTSDNDFSSEEWNLSISKQDDGSSDSEELYDEAEENEEDDSNGRLYH